MRTPLGQLTVLTLLLAVGAGGLFLFFRPGGDDTEAAGKDFALAEIPFDGEQAYKTLKEICAIGPRPSGSKGMAEQQKLLIDAFTALGGKVTRKPFTERHPQTGEPVEMTNLLVEWHPERKERVLICCHYDTRPFPDEDPVNPRGVFIGANDGASGAALLTELGRAMPQIKGKYGVDFLLVDGEEFLFDKVRDRNLFFLGSKHFANDYRANPPAYKYVKGVVIDMIGDKELQIYQEAHCAGWRDTRPVMEEIWGTAARLGVRDFVPRVRHEVLDDHIALHDVAGIPTCELIDFDYPRPGFGAKYWHTQADTPDKCSALSLAKVGWVLTEWLKGLK